MLWVFVGWAAAQEPEAPPPAEPAPAQPVPGSAPPSDPAPSDPAPSDPAPSDPSAAAPSGPTGTRYLLTDAPSTRFYGEDVAGPAFNAGDKVELLVTENGKARIYAGERYGWVDPAVLTAAAPAAATPNLDLVPGGNNPLLGGLPPLLKTPPAPALPTPPLPSP